MTNIYWFCELSYRLISMCDQVAEFLLCFISKIVHMWLYTHLSETSGNLTSKCYLRRNKNNQQRILCETFRTPKIRTNQPYNKRKLLQKEIMDIGLVYKEYPSVQNWIEKLNRRKDKILSIA